MMCWSNPSSTRRYGELSKLPQPEAICAPPPKRQIINAMQHALPWLMRRSLNRRSTKASVLPELPQPPFPLHEEVSLKLLPQQGRLNFHISLFYRGRDFGNSIFGNGIERFVCPCHAHD